MMMLQGTYPQLQSLGNEFGRADRGAYAFSDIFRESQMQHFLPEAPLEDFRPRCGKVEANKIKDAACIKGGTAKK